MFNRSFRAAAGMVFSAVLLLGSMSAFAANCDKRIHDAERNVDKQVRNHGEHSRQAEEARHHLADVRSSCHR